VASQIALRNRSGELAGKEKNEIVRIGMPLTSGTNLYPMVKAQSTEIRPIKTIQKDGVEIWNVSFTSLDCTYVETVRHIAGEGPLPLEVFAERPTYDIYRAVVAHLEVEEGEEISLSDLEMCLNEMEEGDALIVDANGYTDKWLGKCQGVINVSDYNLKSPYFSTQAMRGIIDAGTAILAGNFPSFSNPNTEEGFGIDMIAEFYKTKENMILAPLVNLERIEGTAVVLQINPIAIEGCCGLVCSPVVYQGKLKANFLDYLSTSGQL
jgi:kynurenine formamidase